MMTCSITKIIFDVMNIINEGLGQLWCAIEIECCCVCLCCCLKSASDVLLTSWEWRGGNEEKGPSAAGSSL